MVKKIIAVATTILMLCCMVPLSAFADTHTHTFGDNKRGIDMSSLPDDYYCPVTFYETPCSELCGYSKYEWSFGARSESFVDVTGLNPLQVYAHWHTWFEKAYGAGANLKQYETGGGSAGTGGVGRRPSGYVDDTGTASISQSGTIALAARYYFSSAWNTDIVDSFDIQRSTDFWHFNNNSRKISIERYSSSDTSVSVYCGYILDTNNVPGVYYVPEGTNFVYQNKSSAYLDNGKYPTWTSDRQTSVSSDGTYRYLKLDRQNASSLYYLDMNLSDNFRVDTWSYLNLESTSDFSIDYPNDLIVYCRPTTTINKQTSITINNNTWNGNIYQDNSTNLTYIYPQYTTINENNETVTNISENPIIYNNETKEYYTYDSVTNNYYYITYVTETPTPTPSPDPGTAPTPTPEPGGDTGDTSSILDVLVQIRDNMIQGFADLKATLVQGWADLSANFTLAIENLNLNITNIFNKKFPDQSTPETAQPSPSPSPSPSPDPSTAIPSVKSGATRDFIIPKMTGDSYTDGYGTWVATVFKLWDSSDKALYAFDRDLETLFSSGLDSDKNPTMPCYVQIKIPSNEQFYIDGYTIASGRGYPTEWKLQGSADGENWETVDSQSNQVLDNQKNYYDYPVTLHKAYKYYRLFMTAHASDRCQIYEFNLYGYSENDISITYPTPTPDPSATPTPTPPTTKPSGGNTNNFWNFVFPGGNDDGTENGHKGILWALISLLIAVVTFVLGLGSAYSYVFPFLPAGLVTTIHICVLVLLLFAIIKFVRSFL